MKQQIQVRNPFRWVALSLLLGFSIAACGGGSDGPSRSTGGSGGGAAGEGGGGDGGAGSGGDGGAGSGGDGGAGSGGDGGAGSGGEGGQTDPGFTISIEDIEGRLVQGEEITTQLTIDTQGGYQGQVNLSLDAPPEGISISPSSVMVTDRTPISLTVSSTLGTPTGTHTLTFRASEGEITRTTTVELTVVPPSGALIWTDMFGGSANDHPQALATDGDDNLYVVGQTFSNPLDGQTNSGGWDGFVAKYDSSRQKVWTRLIGTTGTDKAMGVVIDAAGDIYITGVSSGALGGMSRTGTHEIPFVAKLDPAGDILWTQWIGTGYSSASAIALDSESNVYVVGMARAAMNGEVHSGGTVDGYLISFDSDGELRWTRLLGTAQPDTADALAIDGDDNVYVAGTTGGVMHGNALVGLSNIFLSRFDSSGVRDWTTLLGSTGTDTPAALTIDANGDIVLVGHTDSSFEGETHGGSIDAIIVKLDAEGEIIWVNQFGTLGVDQARSVTCSAENDIYVAGTTGAGLSGQSHAGGTDAFLRKIAPDGEEVWTRLLGSPLQENTRGVSFRGDDEICFSGHTEGTLAGHANAGQTDNFLACFAP